jgi:RNA polymerase sigma-70 factor (ECF subfamily)
VSASKQDEQYREAVAAYGDALARLVRAYEADPDLRRDLLQDVHLAIWRSFATFDGRCSVRTWVYRVAHNAATSHALSQQRLRRASWVSLEDIELASGAPAPDAGADQRHTLDRLLTLIRALDPIDRQLMLSYLEGLDAAASSDITGLSPSNVATRIHRIKKLLALRFHSGEPT